MNPYNISDIVGSKILSTHKKINFLKTKKLLEVARKHFNCSDLDGVPLEFMGGAGTAGSHWSKRVMNTDYMIGDSYGENLISEISLALFEAMLNFPPLRSVFSSIEERYGKKRDGSQGASSPAAAGVSNAQRMGLTTDGYGADGFVFHDDDELQ